MTQMLCLLYFQHLTLIHKKEIPQVENSSLLLVISYLWFWRKSDSLFSFLIVVVTLVFLQIYKNQRNATYKREGET